LDVENIITGLVLSSIFVTIVLKPEVGQVIGKIGGIVLIAGGTVHDVLV
jgi:hypothetical protein